MKKETIVSSTKAIRRPIQFFLHLTVLATTSSGVNIIKNQPTDRLTFKRAPRAIDAPSTAIYIHTASDDWTPPRGPFLSPRDVSTTRPGITQNALTPISRLLFPSDDCAVRCSGVYVYTRASWQFSIRQHVDFSHGLSRALSLSLALQLPAFPSEIRLKV